MEGIRATDSSPSILPGAPDDDDDDLGVYNVPYADGYWIYIDDKEEMNAWQKSDAGWYNEKIIIFKGRRSLEARKIAYSNVIWHIIQGLAKI